MESISLLHYLSLSSILFLIGCYGIFFNRKSVLSLIMSIEIIFLAVNINFIAFANYWSDFKGQIFVLFILTVSAAEVAIALVALIVYYSKTKDISIEQLSEIKG